MCERKGDPWRDRSYEPSTSPCVSILSSDKRQKNERSDKASALIYKVYVSRECLRKKIQQQKDRRDRVILGLRFKLDIPPTRGPRGP